MSRKKDFLTLSPYLQPLFPSKAWRNLRTNPYWFLKFAPLGSLQLSLIGPHYSLLVLIIDRLLFSEIIFISRVDSWLNIAFFAISLSPSIEAHYDLYLKPLESINPVSLVFNICYRFPVPACQLYSVTSL